MHISKKGELIGLKRAIPPQIDIDNATFEDLNKPVSIIKANGGVAYGIKIPQLLAGKIWAFQSYTCGWPVPAMEKPQPNTQYLIIHPLTALIDANKPGELSNLFNLAEIWNQETGMKIILVNSHG